MAIILNGDTGISSIGALSGVTSVSSAAADTPVILQDSSSNSNTCRAWVSFDGTGTIAIRGDFNVSSITDGGAGIYTLNFTTAMPDANYACVAITGSGNSSTAGGISLTVFSVTTTTAQIRTFLGTTLTDYATLQIAIFR